MPRCCSSCSRAFALLALLLGSGCSSGAETKTGSPTDSRESLVLLEGWAPVERAEDPFVSVADPPPECEPSFHLEDAQNWLEVDTTACNWVTLRQAARAQVAAGDRLEFDFSHFDLDADAPSTAELRLRFDDCDVWSKSIPIPGAADVYAEQFRSPCRLTRDSQVLFHLHNHGQNTYQLKDLSRLH
jgi:hypothetical protein